ncbi:MAG: aminomethyl-transferring glycine dehydrogenase subunit GcvPA [Alphaproteobacteria bacterium]
MRYLPLTAADRKEMLAAIGVATIDELFGDVPEAARLEGLIDLPRHQGELEVERAFRALAAKNLAAGSVPSFLGAGAYRHHIPATVDHLIQRSEFLTSYTPYQPEVSQGTLQVLFEFQTQVALITAMEVANASMYDGASACAEAVMMAGRLTRRRKVLISGGVHPHYREVSRTNTRFSDREIVLGRPGLGADEELAAQVDAETAALVVQNPDLFGELRDLAPLAAACHQEGALLVVVVTEPVSLGAVTPPGDMGADIVAAEGQGLGVGLNFGGPHLGLLATRQKYVRQMPGRLCGETVDEEGRRGYVLTLSAREQHIRREKATSNICTNSGLCALAFCIHLALLGEAGFRRLAELNHGAAVALAERLASVPGVELLSGAFFNEFTLRLAKPAAAVVAALAERGILAGVPLSRLYPDQPALRELLLVAVTETTTEADSDALVQGLGEVLS